MEDLLAQYENTLQYTEELIQTKEYQSKIADKKNDVEEVNNFENDLIVMKAAITDLNYAIKWLKSGHEPGNKRGIERQAGYKRELPVEPYWIQLNSEKNQIKSTDKTEEQLEREAMKQQLIKQILKVLNKEERTIFEMSANGLSQYEIAKLLRVERDAIKVVIARCRRKIRKEGWVMI